MNEIDYYRCQFCTFKAHCSLIDFKLHLLRCPGLCIHCLTCNKNISWKDWNLKHEHDTHISEIKNYFYWCLKCNGWHDGLFKFCC